MEHIEVYEMSRAGNLGQLKSVTRSIHDPGPEEVQVAEKAIGLNFADIFAMQGLYSATPEGPFVPGLEYSGVITHLGSRVSQFKVGDQVMGVTRFGGYTTGLNIDQQYIEHLPDGWSFEEGAAFPVQALTAYYALFTLGNLKTGMKVLIHSAAGGVGLLANRMAKMAGAYTIGTVGSEKKIPLLKSEGYDGWIVRSPDFGADLEKALDGRPLDLVLECIGGKIFSQGYTRLAPMGRMIVYGSARYGGRGDRPNWLSLVYKFLTRPKIDPQKMIETNRSVMGFNLIWLYDRAPLMKEIMSQLKAMNLPPPIVGHHYQWGEMYQAVKNFQSGATTGKVVVKVP